MLAMSGSGFDKEVTIWSGTYKDGYYKQFSEKMFISYGHRCYHLLSNWNNLL